jgi:surface antigen
MRTVESLPPTHAVVNASVASVSILGPGPVGGTLPPGTLMTSGSFSNTYTRGQCTWYVASRRHVPSNWGDARNWYSRAANSGWSVGSSPAIGAIAWTSAGYYGHVAVVEAINSDHVQIAEMNYNGPYQIDRRWTTASQWRYIY